MGWLTSRHWQSVARRNLLISHTANRCKAPPCHIKFQCFQLSSNMGSAQKPTVKLRSLWFPGPKGFRPWYTTYSDYKENQPSHLKKSPPTLRKSLKQDFFIELLAIYSQTDAVKISSIESLLTMRMLWPRPWCRSLQRCAGLPDRYKLCSIPPQTFWKSPRMISILSPETCCPGKALSGDTWIVSLNRGAVRPLSE